MTRSHYFTHNWYLFNQPSTRSYSSSSQVHSRLLEEDCYRLITFLSSQRANYWLHYLYT